MSFAFTVGCRLRQAVIRPGRRDRLALQPIGEEGPGSVFAMAQLLRSNRLKKPLVVIGHGAESGKDRLLRSLEESDIAYVLWEDLPPLPGEEEAESLRLTWIREICDCFVVLGDRAAMDVVKAAAARAEYRSRTLPLLAAGGELRRRRLPPVAAIPTVAGTGAEALSWACLPGKDGASLVLDGPAMVPAYAVMDPELTEDTPRPALARAVMDGICLGVEAYLSGYGDDGSQALADQALRGFLTAAEPCWNTGGTPAQRTELLRASRAAGLAASRAGYGYARALARGVTALYEAETGDVLAGILPTVMEKYGNHALDRLSDLAAAVGEAGESKSARVKSLIDRLRGLAFRLGLPDLGDILPGDDLGSIAALASAEANPRCACPAVWAEAELTDVLKRARAAHGT